MSASYPTPRAKLAAVHAYATQDVPMSEKVRAHASISGLLAITTCRRSTLTSARSSEDVERVTWTETPSGTQRQNSQSRKPSEGYMTPILVVKSPIRSLPTDLPAASAAAGLRPTRWYCPIARRSTSCPPTSGHLRHHIGKLSAGSKAAAHCHPEAAAEGSGVGCVPPPPGGADW